MTPNGVTSAERVNAIRIRLQRFAPLLVVALLGVAAYVVHEVTKKYNYREVMQRLAEIPGHDMVAAVLLTLASYLVLTGYDVLGLAYVKRPLAYSRIALASFVGYVFSYNVGLSVFGGGAVRYRLYYGWGLSTPEIARIIGIAGLTFWLGVMTLAGTAFIVEPLSLPAILHLPFASSQPLGVILLIVVAAYSTWVLVWRRPIRIRTLVVKPPPPKLLAAQLVISVLDSAVAAGVLFALLPSSTLTYPTFVAFFLLAVVAGLISHVPGGLGVFE